jgi:acyl-CoA hydrolase
MKPKPQKSKMYNHWQIVFPSLVNTHGTLFGGKMLEIMDMMAAIAGSLYCHSAITTVSIEAVDFVHPVYTGNRLETQARVVFVSKTSLIIKVECFAENHLTGERVFCARAYFNMVSLDKAGKPQAAAELLIETDEEKNDYEQAKLLKEISKQRRKQWK